MKKSCQIHSSSKLFILLLLFSTLPYLVQALYVIRTGGYVLWTYSASSIDAGIIGKVVPYLKDIVSILLFISLLIHARRRTIFIAISFYFIILYGAFVLMFSGNFIVKYVLAGIRSYIFIFVVCMFCMELSFYKETERNKVYKITANCIRIVIYIQFAIVLIQVLRSGSLSYFGAGGYRFCGAFGNSGSLGCFCIAVESYLCVDGCKYKYINSLQNFILHLMIMFISVASGMRSAMLLVIMFFCIYTIFKLYELFKVKKDSIIFLTIMIALIFGNYLIDFVITRTDRGEFSQSGSYRVDVLLQLLNTPNNFKLIFGNGIGFGTNAAVNLGIKSSSIFDGTLSTILGQFGVLGLCIFFICLLGIICRIYVKSREYNIIAIGIMVSIIIIFVTGNFFEQIPMVVVIVYSIYLLINEQVSSIIT